MNCPSALSTTKQHLFPPSVVLKLMTPVMCSFRNMPRDLIMILALKHFLFMNAAFSFITQSVKVFIFFISCSFFCFKSWDGFENGKGLESYESVH